MLDHSRSDSPTPVRTATFPDGPDVLLLNPDTPRRRWRAARIRAGLRAQTLLTGLAGVALVVLAGLSGRGFAALVVCCAGIFAVGAAAAVGWRNAAQALTNHMNCATHACGLHRVRGEFFFRSRDFADLGVATSRAVRTLFVAVDELHRSTARAWLDPALCGEVYRVVWRALCCLHRTRAARTLAQELSADPDRGLGEQAAVARQAVAAIDAGVDDVVRHVRGCLLLTRAWEAKLRHTELMARTDHAIAALPDRDDLRQLAEAAEALPCTVFAYITAARDTIGGGAFPWEQPSSTWPRPQHPQPHHMVEGDSPRRKAHLRLVRSGEGPS